MVIHRKTGYVVFFRETLRSVGVSLVFGQTVFIRVVHVTQEQNEQKKKLCFAVFACDLGRVAPINPFYLFARVT
jgi:hypothetical protein